MIKWHVTKDVYTSEQIIQINKTVSNYINTGYGDRPATGKIVKTDIIDFSPELQSLLETVIRATKKQNEEYFGFNLFDRVPYTFNVNTYEQGYEYPFHCDATKPTAKNDIKITAVLNISTEQNSGGDFEFFLDGQYVRVKELAVPGSLLLFPSVIFHRVTPVERGVRKTLSIWFDGPNWK